MLLFAGAALASDEFWDVKSDTWVATDALGRVLPGYEECGPPRPEKQIGIFYFLWLGQHGTAGPFDITRILAENPNNPQWGPMNHFHHWGESELGYYLSTDRYVLRKHCHMLVNAGVDTLIFDCSNGFTYQPSYEALCGVFQEIHDAGGKTPRIVFMAPFVNDPSAVVQALYYNLYAPHRYPDLWYRWEGKPLILADRARIQDSAIRNFFTYRRLKSSYFDPPDAPNQWSWLEVFPQHIFHSSTDPREQMSVGVAQNAQGYRLSPFNVPDTKGRSWSKGRKSEAPDAVLHGLNFEEQWQRALQVDPRFIFITGWNEWVAQRLPEFFGYTGDALFVDSYTQEYSRDVEPMKGGHGDNYYYQMIGNIRRFKGVRPPEQAGPSKTISIDGAFDDWAGVEPEFRDNVGDAAWRDEAGWGSAGVYINTTGRNDFKILKVARDEDYIYFHAETVANITTSRGWNWMMLFIDSDLDTATGWHGYDYLVHPNGSGAPTLKRNTGGWNWQDIGPVTYAVAGKKLELRLPRADIGQTHPGEALLDFHWADNIQKIDDIVEFSISGDSAPDRRFNYRYRTDFTPPDRPEDFTVRRAQLASELTWRHPPDTGLVRTMIRYRTDQFPDGPEDGVELCDVTGEPGSTGAFVHAGLDRRTHYYYSAFAIDWVGNFSKPATLSTAPLPLADLDSDGDIDQDDFGILQACISGPGQVQDDPDCAVARLDIDEDVDAADLAILRACMTGSGVPVTDPACQ